MGLENTVSTSWLSSRKRKWFVFDQLFICDDAFPSQGELAGGPRTETAITTRELISDRAIKVEMLETLADVIAIYVARYGSAEQLRDVKTFDNVTVHVGNMADIYLKHLPVLNASGGGAEELTALIYIFDQSGTDAQNLPYVVQPRDFVMVGPVSGAWQKQGLKTLQQTPLPYWTKAAATAF